MPAEDDMTVHERRTYLKRMNGRSVAAKRGERSQLLPDMEQVTELHRKSLTRLMPAGSLERQKRASPRARWYGLEVERVIVRVWESRDYLCAERLTPGLLTMARHLARFASLGLTSRVHEQLATISRATVARILHQHRSQMRHLPQQGAERAPAATKGVPMGRIPWDIHEPGHCEVDLVYPRGERTAGLHGQAIQLIDVMTGWRERVAVMGRGQAALEGGFRRMVERVPFAILDLHPETGSEFFNQHWVRCWKEQVKGVRLSRSRPSQKNANRMVEQKHDTLVRHSLGQLRLDTPEQVAALDALSEQRWRSSHVVQPVLHRCEKTMGGDKVLRTWDHAKTPYARLLESSVLSSAQQARLQQLDEHPNPFQLREAIYRQLDALWEMATSTDQKGGGWLQ
jgi:hypothetical protein